MHIWKLGLGQRWENPVSKEKTWTMIDVADRKTTFLDHTLEINTPGWLNLNMKNLSQVTKTTDRRVSSYSRDRARLQKAQRKKDK